MLFDECPPYPCDRKYAEASLGYTLRWARRCKAWVQEHRPRSGEGRQHHFGIVQGSVYADLRKKCAEELAAMDFDGYAIGGVSVGEPEDEMLRVIPLPGCRRRSPGTPWGWAPPPNCWK